MVDRKIIFKSRKDETEKYGKIIDKVRSDLYVSGSTYVVDFYMVEDTVGEIHTVHPSRILKSQKF